MVQIGSYGRKKSKYNLPLDVYVSPTELVILTLQNIIPEKRIFILGIGIVYVV